MLKRRDARAALRVLLRRTNTMKYLPNYIPKGTVSRVALRIISRL